VENFVGDLRRGKKCLKPLKILGCGDVEDIFKFTFCKKYINKNKTYKECEKNLHVSSNAKKLGNTRVFGCYVTSTDLLENVHV
jgi:hypothetical protein